MPPKKARLSAKAAINNILRFVEIDEDKCVKTPRVKTLCQSCGNATCQEHILQKCLRCANNHAI